MTLNECVGIRWVSQREFNRETTNTLQGQSTGVVSSQQEGQADVLEWILYYYNTVYMYFRNLSFYMKSFILFRETSWSVIFGIRLQSLAELTPVDIWYTKAEISCAFQLLWSFLSALLNFPNNQIVIAHQITKACCSLVHHASYLFVWGWRDL